MSKNVAVFVDVANLYYAARGQDVDVDYVALLKHATKGRDLIRAYAYSGLDPENENQKKFLEFLAKNGYRVVAKDIRKFGDGRVKANLDIELVVDLFRLAERMDVAVIVSGDGDFAPAIRALQDEGVRCEVISFKPNTSSDLFAVADEFIDVMKISAIGREKGARGVGAPEMPAKEVNPDVGFREASPSVAAAALAAIRGNGEESGSVRGRGRSTGGRRGDRPERTSRSARGARTRAAPAIEPVPMAEARVEAPTGSSAEEGTADAARRRRRRGGRGRGRRGRRGEVELTASQPESDEIQWQELDTLEQLKGLGPDGGSELGLSFEEADAATLAELGLAAQPMPAGPEPAGAPIDVSVVEPAEVEGEAETKKPAPRTRSRSRKAATGDTVAVTASPSAGGRSRTKTTRATSSGDAARAAKQTKSATAKATAGKSGTAAKSGAAAKGTAAAKPRASRARGKAAETAAVEPAGEASGPPAGDEGIWKRFTSGRGTRRRQPSEPPAEG